MNKLISTLKNIFSIEDLRTRILNLILLLVVYRIGTFIVIPGVDPLILADPNFYGNSESGGFLGLVNTFSGGAFDRVSIFALGIMPYISASIVIQLLTVAVPTFQKMQKEGEDGRRKINAITRYLTIAIVLVALSCKPKNNSTSNKSITSEISANELLQKTIDAHGGEQLLKDSFIEFKIDKTSFSLQYDTGRANFKQIRQLDSDTHTLSYKYGNIQYFINDSLQSEESYSKRMAEISLFGFLYTFSIPFNLTANDVIISKQANVTIRQKEYYTLDVQFTKIPDLPEDHFLLYIDIDSYEIGYVALQHDLSGSKPQFRRMIQPRKIKGILFQDYINYKPKEKFVPLDQLLNLYEDQELVQVSLIENKNIKNKVR